MIFVVYICKMLTADLTENEFVIKVCNCDPVCRFIIVLLSKFNVKPIKSKKIMLIIS